MILIGILVYRLNILENQKHLMADQTIAMTAVYKNLNEQRQYMNQMFTLAKRIDQCNSQTCIHSLLDQWFIIATKREDLENKIAPLIQTLKDRTKQAKEAIE